MKPRTRQRTVYLVTGAIVVAMIGGFALAQLAIGQTNISYQGSQTTTVTAVPGLTWVNTTLFQIPGAAAITNPCTAPSVCNAATSAYTICAGGFPAQSCAASDFVENITLTTIVGTPFPNTAISLTVYLTGTPVGSHSPSTYVGPTCYFYESVTPATAETITLFFDIGTEANGPGSVTSVSVIATT